MSHSERRVLSYLRIKAMLFTLFTKKVADNTVIISAGRKQFLNAFAAVLEDAISYRKPMVVNEVVFFPIADGQYARCPRCKITMEREYARYCDRCGQRLDWDGYDDALIVINTGIKCD